MSWRRLFRAAVASTTPPSAAVILALLLLLPTPTALAQNINVGRLLRFSCSQLVIERTDPLVSPGSVPSPHVHQIVGGDSFNATMDPADLDPARDSACTSCTYAQDFSNYWTASLYFRSPENGSYRMVPQQHNFVGLDGERHPQNGGGITVYYMTAFGPGAGSQRVITAFRPVSLCVSLLFRFCLILPPLSSVNHPLYLCPPLLSHNLFFTHTHTTHLPPHY